MPVTRTPRSRARQLGTSMIEVLVSIVIVVLGLLGLAGLQTQASLSEMEAFQRAQATALLQDMADRLNANRFAAMNYVTADPVGTGGTPADCPAQPTAHERDLCEWGSALRGAAEKSGGADVGAMIGARGCITAISPNMPRQFEIAVVWQGINSTKAPGTGCGADLYGDEKKRRAVTTRVIIGCLQNDPATGLCIFPP